MSEVQKYIDDYINTQIEEEKISESLSDEQAQKLSEKYQWNLATFIEVIDIDGQYELPQNSYDTFVRLIEDSEKIYDMYKDQCTETFVDNLSVCKSLIGVVTKSRMDKMT